ncbi:MAG: ABC transporter permease subunit [Gemmiger sp.]|nr:ABC transporter permease subunit [Gemmiger sp.]
MAALGLLYLFINNYMPMAGLVLAFKQYNARKGIWGSDFNGLKNFEFLFKTRDAWIITRNTIAYNAVFIVLGTIFSVTVAILLNEVRSAKAKKLYQTVTLIPYMVSIVVVSYLANALLATDNGFINTQVLAPLGQDPVAWYTTPGPWPVILVLINLWKGFGYSSIIYFATLVGINREYYEAAVIDGASWWQQVTHVTLPGLKNTIITMTLLSVGRIFYSDFGLFYQVPMNSGPLYDVTNTIDTYVYRGLMQNNNIGMASAAGFYQSLVGFALVLAANTIVKKISPENALY